MKLSSAGIQLVVAYPEDVSEFNLALDYNSIIFPKIDSVIVYNNNNYYCILANMQSEWPNCIYNPNRHLAYSYRIRNKLLPFVTVAELADAVIEVLSSCEQYKTSECPIAKERAWIKNVKAQNKQA